MITKDNYSKHTMDKVTHILPRGTKQEVADETNETYTTVSNVWCGKQYKENIIKCIIKRHNLAMRKLAKQTV